MIKLTTKGFDAILKAVDEEERNILNSIAKAHSTVASQAVKVLKAGLNQRAGRDYKDPSYETSPVGALPYMHTGRLRNSIGFKLLKHGNTIFSEVGSGASGNTIDYAKYLEGDGNGIRPFLWAADPIYNPKNILKVFNQIYKSILSK